MLLSDIKPEDLATKLSRALRCTYLSPSSHTHLSKVQGYIYGPNQLSMFTLPVGCKGDTKNVHFLFVTGAPATFLATSALDAWDVPSWDVDNFNLLINVFHMRPRCSDDPVWDRAAGV